MNESSGSATQLKRTLGLFDATAISIGAIIGAGIFVVTGMVAGIAGSGAVLSILIAGVIAFFIALNFAQLSAYMPKEGGGYEFTYSLISPFAGFLSGWMWIFSNTFASAAVSLGFAHYLTAIFPTVPVQMVAVILCLSFTFLNYVGIRQSTMLNNLLVVSKILILLFFVALGLSFVNMNNFSPFAPNGVSGIFGGAALIFFAYGGYARVTTVAEEVKDPSRTVPRAIILALGVSTLLYLLIGFVAIGLVGSSTLAGSNSPLTEAISLTGNQAAVLVVSMGAMIATASVLLMSILGVSRMTFAMARNRQLPAFLSRIHPRFQTPHHAVWITGLLSTALVFGGFSRVVAASTFSLLFHHALVNLSATRLEPKNRRYPRFVPVAGLLLCLALLAFLPGDAWSIGIIGLVIGAAYYTIRMKI